MISEAKAVAVRTRRVRLETGTCVPLSNWHGMPFCKFQRKVRRRLPPLCELFHDVRCGRYCSLTSGAVLQMKVTLDDFRKLCLSTIKRGAPKAGLRCPSRHPKD